MLLIIVGICHRVHRVYSISTMIGDSQAMLSERISFTINRIKHKLNKLYKFIVSKDLLTSLMNMKLLVNS